MVARAVQGRGRKWNIFLVFIFKALNFLNKNTRFIKLKCCRDHARSKQVAQICHMSEPYFLSHAKKQTNQIQKKIMAHGSSYFFPLCLISLSYFFCFLFFNDLSARQSISFALWAGDRQPHLSLSLSLHQKTPPICPPKPSLRSYNHNNKEISEKD